MVTETKKQESTKSSSSEDKAKTALKTTVDKQSGDTTVTMKQLTEAIDRGLEKWRKRHCHNTPLGKSTPALNYVRGVALPELPELIIKEIK